MSSSLFGGQGLRGPTGGSSGFKAPRGYESVSNYTPDQMQLFQQLFSHVGPESYLSKLAGGDQDTFNQIEAPALQQFSGIQGNIASRFSGMGLGARKSSGFQNTINQAGSDFAQQLQSQRQGLQQNALQQLMEMSGSLLERNPYSIMPKKKSFLQELLGSLAGGVGQAGGTLGSLYGLKKFGLLGG